MIIAPGANERVDLSGLRDKIRMAIERSQRHREKFGNAGITDSEAFANAVIDILKE